MRFKLLVKHMQMTLMCNADICMNSNVMNMKVIEIIYAPEGTLERALLEEEALNLVTNTAWTRYCDVQFVRMVCGVVVIAVLQDNEDSLGLLQHLRPTQFAMFVPFNDKAVDFFRPLRESPRIVLHHRYYDIYREEGLSILPIVERNPASTYMQEEKRMSPERHLTVLNITKKGFETYTELDDGSQEAFSLDRTEPKTK